MARALSCDTCSVGEGRQAHAAPTADHRRHACPPPYSRFQKVPEGSATPSIRIWDVASATVAAVPRLPLRRLPPLPSLHSPSSLSWLHRRRRVHPLTRTVRCRAHTRHAAQGGHDRTEIPGRDPPEGPGTRFMGSVGSGTRGTRGTAARTGQSSGHGIRACTWASAAGGRMSWRRARARRLPRRALA